ncbi:hypothetical protein CQW23_10610 [Capsicum baccatum]|uniref:Uncharacterized protein n=1 Tax=Capsicum baccatum TaxID=33114 RepID=A0A2G2X068_CAPBA|nr:hypothetical protein CQW23_10610 [Capsicum baccatum]
MEDDLFCHSAGKMGNYYPCFESCGWPPKLLTTCLISLLCSCACNVFNNSAKVILDRSFVFCKVIIDASYLSGTVIRIFSTILESLNFVPNNLILLTMLRSRSEYSLTVSDSFIFCNSNSLIRFNTFMPRILSSQVVMDNGTLQVTLSVPDGIVTGITYNGVDNLLEFLNDETNRGYWDVVWSSAGTTGTTGSFERLRCTNYKVILETDDQIELSFSRKWDASLQGKLIPLNIDKRFIMLKGSSGFYSYAIYEHLEGWPGFNLDETRIVFKLRKDKFHYMAMADNRQRYMPLPDDRLPDRGQPLAYPEAVLLVNPIEPEFKGEVDDKYQYSCEDKDLKVHGWICMDPSIGFWIIIPSDEFRSGGPLKQNLTSHVGPTALSVSDTLKMEGTTSQTMDSNEMENMRVTLEAMTRTLERLSTEVGAKKGEVKTISGEVRTSGESKELSPFYSSTCFVKWT